MRPSALLYMYRHRLRSHGVQELLAAVGIAIAVALVFAAIVAEQSISSSADRVVRTVIGPASLQLQSRSGDGFDESMLSRVKRLPGVKQAAPLLEQTATLVAPGGRSVRVQLAGADLRLAVLDGLGETLPIGALSTDQIGLSRTSARVLGIGAAGAGGSAVTLKLRGRTYELKVSSVLGEREAGALSQALLAVMPLSRMQRLAGLPGRVTRIFVQTQPGREADVRAELGALAGGRIEVAQADRDIALLREALGPSDLASGLFAAIGALLGFLLAFNAMLLTVSDRRRVIADLRIAGARRTTIVEMVLFEALCLGIVASVVGLFAGYLLSVGAFHQSTGYLAEAFSLSGGTVVHGGAVALALGGGVLATCLASIVPLLDLRRGRSRDAIYKESGAPGHSLGANTRIRLAGAGLALIGAASVLWALLPSAAIPATALLALATVLAVPLAFAGVLSLAEMASERLQRVSILPLALASLRATTIRSLALAATGAVALFGSVALGGARSNLLAGIHSFANSYVADAPIWVSNPGDNQAVNSFAADPASASASSYPSSRPSSPSSSSTPTSPIAARIARVPGVASIRAFQGGFVTLGSRRVWVIARPAGAQRHVLESEVQAGQASTAVALLSKGGWIALSSSIAAEHHVGVGGTLTLPTPSGPRPFKVAATTTNLAWPPGVIFMSAASWSRDWASGEPTALGVTLGAGANAEATRAAIEKALGPSSGLEVSLASERASKIDTLAGEGLGQLREISILLLVAAIVAMAAALGSSIWQRRSGLASLRLFGAKRLSLQGILLLEAMLMLGAGCVTGAIAGVYGQVVIDGFLRQVTGFPLQSPATSAQPVETLALVLLGALAIGAIPGWLACRVRPVLALAEE